MKLKIVQLNDSWQPLQVKKIKRFCVCEKEHNVIQNTQAYSRVWHYLASSFCFFIWQERQKLVIFHIFHFFFFKISSFDPS